MSCKWMISHVLPMNNPTQTLPCKSLNAAGKWAFLPRLTAPQRWSKRLSLCNSTSCSVPVKPALKHFSHDLGIWKKKKTNPPPLSAFYPFVVKLFLALEIQENEKQRDSKREGERCLSQCQWIIGSLQNPIRKDGVETDHSVLHGRIRAAAHCVIVACCIALLATLLLISSLWAPRHSRGINPAVIMLVRVTGSVACVETPVVLWLQCSASGVLPAFAHTHPKRSSVTYVENTHTPRLVAQSPVSLFNKDGK